MTLDEDGELGGRRSLLRVFEAVEFCSRKQWLVKARRTIEMTIQLTLPYPPCQLLQRLPRAPTLPLPPLQPRLRIPQLQPKVIQIQLQHIQRRNPRAQTLVVVPVRRERCRRAVEPVVEDGGDDIFELGEGGVDAVFEDGEVLHRGSGGRGEGGSWGCGTEVAGKVETDGMESVLKGSRRLIDFGGEERG